MRMTLHQLVPLFALAFNILLLGSALIGNRKQHRNWAFAAVAIAMSVWNLGVFGLRSAADAEAAMVWERILHLGVVPIPIFFYHYVLTFLDLPRRGLLLGAGYGLAVFFLAVSPTALFMPGVVSTYWGFAPKPGPLYGAFLLYFYLYCVVGLVLLVRAYRSMASSFRRNRTRLVIFGACLAQLGSVVDFVRWVFGWERLYPFGIPTSTIFAICLGIAIVRYRLWDLEILARRVFLYVLMALAVGPVVVVALTIVGKADDLLTNVPFIVTVLAGVALMLPLLRHAETWVARIMFSRQHGVRDALNALSRDMAAVLELERLGQTLTHGLVSRVPVVHATLYLQSGTSRDEFSAVSEAHSTTVDAADCRLVFDPRLALWLRLAGRPLSVEEISLQGLGDARTRDLVRALEAARVALLVPLFSEGELTAMLLVGEKLSGEIFESHEVELLEMLMGQTAIALKNSQLYADLQRQMEELRTTQQQLVQSAKLAAIGELAASVAHELNNPLTVIVGHTEVIRDAGLSAGVNARIDTIASQAMHAAKITRSLLDFSRKREPKHEPLNINRLVPRALELIQARLRKRPIEVAVALDERMTAMLGDVDQLTQVIINLVGNAIDAMPDGGGLGIRTEVDQERDWLRLVVCDTGVGIAPEQLSHIFEPFFTTKPEGKGTGLGLSVSLGIVKNHGGGIEVTSEPGEGTAITVCLPLSSAPRPDRLLTPARENGHGA